MYFRVLLVCLSLIVVPSLAISFAQAEQQSQPSGPSPSTDQAPPGNSPSSADATRQAQTANDAAGKVQSAVVAAQSLLDKADRYQKDIASITASDIKRTQAPLDDLQTIQSAATAIQQADLMNALTKAKPPLDKDSAGSAASALRTECDKLAQFSSLQQQDVTDAQAKCSTVQKQATDQLAALGAAITSLQNALQSVYAYVANQTSALTTKIQPLCLLPPESNSVVLLTKLPSGLPALRQVLADQQQYQAMWNSTAPLLKQPGVSQQAASGAAPSSCNPATIAAGTVPNVDDQFKALQAAIDAVLPKLDHWFTTITATLQEAAKKLDGMIPDVETDPAKNSATAFDAVRDQADALASVQSIVDAWPPLVGFLVDGKPDNFHLKTTKKDFEDLQKWTNSLRSAISRIHDALAGDFNNFEADQVSLYYFTDVSRLMYVLNESVQTMGGVADAQAKAAAQRTALTQTELELADAQATVNRYQKQVLDLQEQQRQQQVKLKGLNANVSKLSSRLKHAQDAKDTAGTDYKRALDEQKAAPNDPTLARAVDRAKAKQDASATKLSQDQSDYDAAKTDRDNAQKQVDDSQNLSDSLPAKLAAAQQSLGEAQTAVAQERRKMLMAAQAESDAFAFARDNTPFMYAPAEASSPNPAKRVMLYAFNDSKTIFMRGNPKDLALVKHIIAEFDRPAPQARLTLWTFELNAESGQKTNKKAAENLNKSMEIIDEELSQTRALENTTLSLLRDFINQEVRTCFKQSRNAAPADEAERQASQEAKQEKTERAGCNPRAPTQPQCPQCTWADFQKLRRLTFYDPLVLEQPNFNMEKVDVEALRKLIPDPAGTTTLGEALMILSLAPLQTRLAVRDEFELAIQKRLRALPLSPKLDRCAWFHPDPENLDRKYDRACRNNAPRKGEPCTNGECLLPLTWHGVDIWEQGIKGSGAGLTSSQLEITRALRTAYDGNELRQVLDKLESWYGDIGSIIPRLNKLHQDLSELEDRGKANLPDTPKKRLSTLQQLGNNASENDTAERNRLVQQGISLLSATDRNRYDQEDAEERSLEARRDSIRLDSAAIVDLLQCRGIDTTDLVSKLGVTASDNDFRNGLLELKILAYQSPSLSAASPRVAAADEMLKEIIIALEDDLDRLFVQPMIRGLRTRLTAETGVRVGILQRESLLATNRGKARVDPRASAQLAVGEEQDILSGVQQLAQLYSAVQSGGALAALGALQKQPREPQPEIYALTTGSKFEVTPIFDPSGQALRFKFDFVSTSNLQEPNGTTNPQFPRIERHTVNTEVQLSNLETREISRFESNARLGLPTTYWGGFPVLKDIPYVRPWIPLVGWFVRKGGSNGSAQQSVIFGQTTMYPTIGTIIDLLSESGLKTENAPQPPPP